MEKDINTIVDVDPDEARVLIELIELFVSETYVREHRRQQNIAAATAIARLKKEARAGSID